MLSTNPKCLHRLAFLACCILLFACGAEEPPGDEPTVSGAHPVLGDLGEVAVDASGALGPGMPEGLARRVESMATAAAGADPAAALVVDYPRDESVFPPEFVAPTFLWHDPAPKADTWLVEITFADDSAGPIRVLVPGAPPPKGEPDPDAYADTNRPWEGTDYQNSAISWTPGEAIWREVKLRSVEAPATLRFTGFASQDQGAPLSRGVVRITTSKDPVGAPLFYRDVPLMPAVGEQGRIQPLGEKAIPLIAWRLKDVSKHDSKLVLKGMPACGNCHSFSRDGKTLGMDVDGPDGDKGMYAIKPVSKKMVIGSDDVITWNSFPDKPEGHRTIGFMSRVSPDGRYVATTVNEALYVSNFPDHRFLQVFYPTRGILAVHSREEGTMHALPGADDPEYVHCSPAWTPDGSQIVFSRAKAFDPYRPGQKMAKYPNDPNEPKIRYDLYRLDFNDGEGGDPVPVEGASNNGMSNTFPKVSPDGKWIVWTRCKNGLLMRPDSRLWIVPFEGGEAREMRCNTDLMNSWHSFSPNGRWLVFTSKSNRPYTQAFLTHIDEDGNDSPAILVTNCTASNRAVNLPEFLNAPIDALDSIEVPVVKHHVHAVAAQTHFKAGRFEEAMVELEQAIEADPTFVRAIISLGATLTHVDRHDEAIVLFERAAALSPRDLLALGNLANSYRSTGRAFMAQKTLERLVEFAPMFPEAQKDLERARETVARLKAGIEECRGQLDRDPSDIPNLVRLSDLYRRTGRLEEAVETLGRVVELNPSEPRFAAGLAWILSTNPDGSIRDGDRALVLARRAVKLTGGTEFGPLDVLACALAETGSFEEAVRTAEKALALANESAPRAAGVIEGRLQLLRSGRKIRMGADR